ncbi:hypothetical protein pb186bvf_015760 [Paramecium bursaria]
MNVKKIFEQVSSEIFNKLQQFLLIQSYLQLIYFLIRRTQGNTQNNNHKYQKNSFLSKFLLNIAKGYTIYDTMNDDLDSQTKLNYFAIQNKIY